MTDGDNRPLWGFSAVIGRGLIEGRRPGAVIHSDYSGFPRSSAAASLKDRRHLLDADAAPRFSAVIGRGLIEGPDARPRRPRPDHPVFRGHRPRPH